MTIRSKLLVGIIVITFGQSALAADIDDSKACAVAFAECTKLAESGDASAQDFLGHIYESGDGALTDVRTAFGWYLKAAEQGTAHAQYRVGMLKLHGIGTDQDDAEALRWFIKGAEGGNARAQFNAGALLQEAGNTAEAIRWYEQAAAQDQGDAIFALAEIYRTGNGVPIDLYATSRLDHQAAELGDPMAQTALAVQLIEGKIVPKDMAAAAVWLEKAASQNYAAAQTILSSMYVNGEGVPVDYVKAYRLLEAGITNEPGNADESRLAARIAQDEQAKRELMARMTPAQLAEAQRPLSP